MRTISLFCPTRGRPGQVIRLLDSLYETTENPNKLEILFYIDDNDPSLDEYISLMDKWLLDTKDPFKLCEVSIGPQISLTKVGNFLFERCTGDVFCSINDDFVYRTKGWDVRLNQEADRFSDDIYCIWFDDGRNGHKKCIMPHMSRGWVNALGYYYMEIFRHYFCDTWLFDVAKICNRAHYVGDVLIEHMHYLYGKSERDTTYLEKEKGLASETAQDKFLYERTLYIRELEAYRLLKAAKEYSVSSSTKKRIKLSVPNSPLDEHGNININKI